MRILDPHFAGPLLAAMLATQGLCWLLARGLRLRLGRSAVLGGWIVPLLVLAPWIAGPALLVPCNLLQDVAPGAPVIFSAEREHDLLNDVIYQLLPWELEVRHAFAQGRLPLWSDSLGGGSSPWANPQAGAFSPLQMAARGLPLQHHLLGALILKLLVGFQGTWLLARSTGRGRASSLLAAAGFALGGGLFSWALFPVTATAAWVPWLAAGTVRLCRHPSRRVVATTAAITALILLSGHPETAVFGGAFAGVCGFSLRRRAAGLGRSLAAAVLAATLGFGLAAPLLLPFVASIPDSQRAHDTRDPGRPAGTMWLLAPITWFQPGYGSFVLAPASPHAFGPPYQVKFQGPFNWAEFESGYTGLVAFAGAWLALLLAARDRRAWPFVGFAAAGLLLAGHFLPLARLLYLVPPLRMPAYARLLPVVSLALCVAGAFGTDLLLRRGRARSRTLAIWASLALAALTSLAVASDRWTIALWILLAAAVALAGWRPPWGAVALAAVLLLDLIPWSRSLLPVGHPSLFYPRSALMDRLVQETGDPAAGRGTGGDYLVYPGVLHVYGVADFRAHDPLASAAYLHVLSLAFGFHPSMEQYFAPIRNLDHPLLDFLGVRAVVGSPAVPRYRTLPRIDDGAFAPYTLMRNPDALPRWFFPSESVPIERGSLDRWIAGMTAARQVAVFRDEVGPWRPLPGRPASPDPRVVSAVPGRVVLEVARGGEALLASSVPFSRGWSARAGGRTLQMLRVDGAFLGVRLPAGASRVELRFLPPGFVTGCGAFGLSLGAFLFLLLAPRGFPMGAPAAAGQAGKGIKS
jgi:hypothetical protein